MIDVKRVKLACYATNACMALICNLSPLLFLIFHELYGISYSLLGALVLVNFVSQLSIDLIFSFFNHRFNMKKCLCVMPLLAVAGLTLYAVSPWILPGNEYIGLAIGTVIFSFSSGFAEVLISPTIAALPAKDPDREMSKLHSVYAWGVVGAVIAVTLYLHFLGSEAWQWLVLATVAIPISVFFLFLGARLPELKTEQSTAGSARQLRDRRLLLALCGIILGAMIELIMAQWASGYIEEALELPKLLGDILGVAMFSVMLGLGRTLYSKVGKNIERTLLTCAIGAVICYSIAALSPWAWLGLIACAVTGIAASMLWPGSLVALSKKLPSAGVFMYAIMAAGGDFGAAVGPQLVGIITDAVCVSEKGIALAARLGITPAALGMKCGMLLGAIVGVLAVVVFTVIYLKRDKSEEK